MKSYAAMESTIPRRGFSLLELLIVIAVIGALFAIIVPALQAVRETARRTECANQLRQVAIATESFVVAKEHFPPGVEQWFFNSSVAYRGIPLFAYLLPYIENQNALTTWDYIDPINNANKGNRSNTAFVLPLLICPSDRIKRNPIVMASRDWHYALASYGGNGGTKSYFPTQSTADGIFHTTGEASEPVAYQVPTRPRDVTDGVSHTILFGERSHVDPNYQTFNDAGWGEPLDEWGWWGASTSRKMVGHVTMSASQPINYRLGFTYAQRAGKTPPSDSFNQFQTYVEFRVSAYGSSHPDGANFAFADGSVRFVNDQITLDMLKALSTRAGTEVEQSE